MEFEIGEKVSDKKGREGIIIFCGPNECRVRWLTDHGVAINVANPEKGRRTWVKKISLVPAN